MSTQDRIWVKAMSIFSHSCHQLPQRSFFIKNKQLPVCARCLGIYLGYLLGLILYFINDDISIYILLVMLVITFLDGTIQLISRYESTNRRRFITGMISGCAIFYLIIKLITYIF